MVTIQHKTGEGDWDGGRRVGPGGERGREKGGFAETGEWETYMSGCVLSPSERSSPADSRGIGLPAST